MKVDLTVLAIPAYFAAIGAEYAWQRAHPVEPGTRAGDYQTADTLASLAMGVGSLVAPYVAKSVLDPVTPGKGRYGRALLAAGAAAAVLTTVGDVVRRRLRDGRLPDPQTVPGDVREVQEELAGLGWRPRPRAERPSAVPASHDPRRPGGRRRRRRRAHRVDRLGGAHVGRVRLPPVAARPRHTWPAWAVAILGWDFIYYWNHRFSHESRWLWAVHVAHHSSERYNLSTALRQPVADSITLAVPYSLLALARRTPVLIEQARGLNLIYQFWIHTEAIRPSARSSGCSTPRRTTGCTTAPTGTTSTATTAAS